MCYQSRCIHTKRWKHADTKHGATLLDPQESFIRKPSTKIVVLARRIIQHILALIQRAHATYALYELYSLA
jgi:hypothetical protein